jgi:transcriptional regulator with XRE-family HTH domain
MLIPDEFHLERKRLGQMLRLAREEGGFTVREVAAVSGLDFTHVSKIELGNTNVSLEKFARLCYALMIPPGIVLESFIWVGRAEGFLNDPMVTKLASEHPEKLGLDGEISDFIAGTALALSYTLKSSNPLLMLDNMEFAVEPQRDDFKKYASRKALRSTPSDRRDILLFTLTKGWEFLASIGLLNDAHLKSYLADAQHRKRPWIPIPKAPFFQTEMEPVDSLKINVQLLIHAARRAKPPSLQKKKLTEPESYANVSEVKQPLKNLLARLNYAAQESGKMSALADFLGKATGHKVPLASVSRWLSGKREPGGEITLMLLQWVERQERQK